MATWQNSATATARSWYWRIWQQDPGIWVKSCPRNSILTVVKSEFRTLFWVWILHFLISRDLILKIFRFTVEFYKTRNLLKWDGSCFTQGQEFQDIFGSISGQFWDNFGSISHSKFRCCEDKFLTFSHFLLKTWISRFCADIYGFWPKFRVEFYKIMIFLLIFRAVIPSCSNTQICLRADFYQFLSVLVVGFHGVSETDDFGVKTVIFM